LKGFVELDIRDNKEKNGMCFFNVCLQLS